MKTVVCTKCGEELLFANDSGKEEIVTFKTQCPCGHVNVETFLGYPKLAGNERYYFEFVDENKIMCKPRVTYKKVIKNG